MASMGAIAMLLVGYALVFVAVVYQKRQLESRFREGPWVSATIKTVWFSDSPKHHPDIRFYQASVEFPNIVDGKSRQCVGTANIGRHGEMKPGDRLRIAPLPGTCGDIAMEYD